MNVIDSSMWLEYFAGTENGDHIADVIENTDELIVPTITIYEVFKKLKLPMADSIIYATNIKYNCVLWTQDKHFSGLQSVNYLEKTRDNQ